MSNYTCRELVHSFSAPELCWAKKYWPSDFLAQSISTQVSLGHFFTFDTNSLTPINILVPRNMCRAKYGPRKHGHQLSPPTFGTIAIFYSHSDDEVSFLSFASSKPGVFHPRRGWGGGHFLYGPFGNVFTISTHGS